MRRHSAVAVVAIVVVAYVAVLAGVGGVDDWKALGVPSLSPSFADTRVVTTGWDCARLGYDVLVANPCDPWDRPLNYPRVWTLPSHLGIGQGATVAIGIAIAVTFFTSLLLLVRGSPLRTGVICAAAVVSPSVMLGVERGNVDLLIFALLVGALLALQRTGVVRDVGAGLLFFAAVLKLYPVAAFSVLIRQPRRYAIAAGAVTGLAFIVYALLTWHDVSLIRAATPHSDQYSYGADIGVSDFLEALEVHTGASWAATGTASTVTKLVFIGIATALAWIVARKSVLPRQSCGGATGWHLDAFIAGSSIFILTFVSFANWQYRLVFLLLTLPQLSAWIAQEKKPVPLPWLTIALELMVLWLAESPRLANITMKDAASWALFVLLASSLFAVVLAERPSLAHRERTTGSSLTRAIRRPWRTAHSDRRL